MLKVAYADSHAITETAEQLSTMGWAQGVGVPGIIQRAAEPPRRTVVGTVDERGRPARRAFTDDELAAGVPEYVEPSKPEFEWVLRGGDPLQIDGGKVRRLVMTNASMFFTST